mmetsp:Transcript_36433/g.85180  ORF Transcript_36433/g.85180 Transcript_36433/m.85180 type:complete len:162 (-) Transcript_36433:246-731(-)
MNLIKTFILNLCTLLLSLGKHTSSFSITSYYDTRNYSKHSLLNNNASPIFSGNSFQYKGKSGTRRRKMTPYSTRGRKMKLYSNENDDDDNTKRTKVGSEEYYRGFVSRKLNEEPAERVTGDALLGPILKFAGGASVIIAVFLFLFLVSNDILSIPTLNLYF